MKTTRTITHIWQSQPTIEGAGVHLKRAFGYSQVPQLDPFLMLDDFHSQHPADYLAGFPWHPHRGIETVTYMLRGEVEHGDSLGNRGVIGSGDVQWMTAGSGIIHQEMPQKTEGDFQGVQLWVNLPASHKMMPPRYRDVSTSQIPEITLESGVRIKIISGNIGETVGPVQDIVVPIHFLDVLVPAQTTFIHPVNAEDTVFVYVLESQGNFAPERSELIPAERLILFAKGDQIHVSTHTDPVHFLLLCGKPLGEPVAWRGPIVMNTTEELATAFREYHEGTFIKHGEQIRKM
ncbi:pirin domain protein [Candidatus Vecturithrix granuli]|uniref:Pirin domain protein n=1 Tax=Vecturithrix granuli TaxID=1499967 RepID=A0A081BV18_VECG1|nr:pirin domain protein [Candidatus Vecturithrix granuli]